MFSITKPRCVLTAHTGRFSGLKWLCANVSRQIFCSNDDVLKAGKAQTPPQLDPPIVINDTPLEDYLPILARLQHARW